MTQAETNVDADLRQRRIGLDLVRSAAILLVIVSHYAHNLLFWFGIHPPYRVYFSGDAGVELFFALSGFLIGRILLDIAERDPSWRNLWIFLVRRWMRTLPVYWLCLLALAATYPPTNGHVGDYVLRFGSLTQNFLHPMPDDDWFAVSWSLTIEEWFYLAFGTGVIVAMRLIRRKWAFWLPLLVLLVVPLALRLSVPAFADGASGLTKMAPFRMDEIGYGVVLAWVYDRKMRLFDHPVLLLLCGLGLIAATWLQELPVSPWLYASLRYNVTVIGCVMCIPAALRLQRVPCWLGATARTLSRQSYALYLIHLSVLLDIAQRYWWTHHISAVTAALIALTLPFALAELMSRYVELPIMRLRPPQQARVARIILPLATP